MLYSIPMYGSSCFTNSSMVNFLHQTNIWIASLLLVMQSSWDCLRSKTIKREQTRMSRTHWRPDCSSRRKLSFRPCHSQVLRTLHRSMCQFARARRLWKATVSFDGQHCGSCYHLWLFSPGTQADHFAQICLFKSIICSGAMGLIVSFRWLEATCFAQIRINQSTKRLPVPRTCSCSLKFARC